MSTQNTTKKEVKQRASNFITDLYRKEIMETRIYISNVVSDHKVIRPGSAPKEKPSKKKASRQ